MAAKREEKRVVKERYTLYVPKDHLAILQKMSEGSEDELSVASFVRRAIREFLDRQGGKKGRR